MREDLYMTADDAKTINSFMRSLRIFAKYENPMRRWPFEAEHDIIYGPDKPSRGSADGDELERAGWHWDEDVECWAYFT